ncbi:MAG: MFS transporter [Gaiellaceae bacterium]
MIALRGRLGALEERPFRLLWLGRSASAIGDALIPVALAFAVVSDLDGSASDLGLVLASFSVSQIAFMLVGGVWADRLPRRSLLIACDVVRGLAEAFTAIVLLTGAAEVWMLAVTSFVFGAASAFFRPAATGLVPETVSGARLQEANALLGISQSATNVFGPVLSGILVAVAGAGWVFAIDAVTFAVSAAFLLALRLPAASRPPRQRFLADLAAGWRHVSARTWLWTNLLASSVINVAVATFFVLGPLVAERELGGAAAWGAILTGGAIGGVLGGAIALRFRPHRPLVANYLVILPVSLPLLLLVRPFPASAVAVGAAFLSGGIMLGNAIWNTVVQSHVPRDALSRVSSYDLMISVVFMPVGFALAGPVAAAIGEDATLVGAATLAVAANLAVIAVPDVWRIRTSPRAAAAVAI